MINNEQVSIVRRAAERLLDAAQHVVDEAQRLEKWAEENVMVKCNNCKMPLWNGTSEHDRRTQPEVFGDYMVIWAGTEWRATFVPATAIMRPEVRGYWVLRDRMVGFLWWKRPLRIQPTHWRQPYIDADYYRRKT